MEIYEVEFLGGESVHYPPEPVNYMLVTVNDATLYSEVLIPNDIEDFELYGYEKLKADIIEQAKGTGIDPDTLRFFFDVD